ncbi:MAG: UDP-N-acetylmuramoyl-L-alanyl-D-glutamate--2,6-diaminopimelate ligase, partial [Candidatus Eremiobacteraeota bacterium]|nr:UDP-N-acetylmuramoyl-L-alanyl-D-glutamate--2,6-diaminopimelate ligase [Candidatus Eremiobacteraeota bacterium]
MAADTLRAFYERLGPDAHILGDPATQVRSIEVDSRRVTPGSLFVAVRGAHVDGHAFLADAIARGAAAVVIEARAEIGALAVPALLVHDSLQALSPISAAFYGDPSHALSVIGITGTNGKTTSTRMLAAICAAAQIPCGVIGTVGAEFGARSWTLANTTPLPHELHALLAAMREDGARAVAIEVSSHALALGRVDDVRFAAAGLSNITQDHLDFHGSIEAYAAAKRRLFDLAPACAFGLDDRWGAQWFAELAAQRRCIGYALEGPAEIRPEELHLSPTGASFTLDGVAFEQHLPGRFNVENALLAIALARLMEIDTATAARGIAALQGVPGRMQRVGNGDINIIVDYAHTPNALENALLALRESLQGRLILVFGCGGDRDRSKRRAMGEVAARLADQVYLTNDNPRSEEPQAIVEEILAGMQHPPAAIELDRRRAIERAVLHAAAGDTVLVAGKGHENYQVVGDRVLPFDDVATAADALARRRVGA